MLGLDETQMFGARCSVDICDCHVYVFVGNSDTSLLLFLKHHITGMPILMGCFDTFERS